MEAGDRNDKKLFLSGLVNDAVRETGHLASADITAERMPGQWKVPDTLNRGPGLLAEFGAKLGPLKIVVVNGDSQFAPRRQQEPDFQTFCPSSAKASCASTASSSPAR